jgi:hypothetical protein
MRAGDVRGRRQHDLVEQAQRDVLAELELEVTRPVEVGLVLDADDPVDPLRVADRLSDVLPPATPLALEEARIDGRLDRLPGPPAARPRERFLQRSGLAHADVGLDGRRGDGPGGDGRPLGEPLTGVDERHVDHAGPVEGRPELSTDDGARRGLEVGTQGQLERELAHG